MRILRKVTVAGQVQGVGYRAFVAQAAAELGLEGWVRNCRDGSVQAMFAGEGQQVADMLTRCRGGPPGAKVSDVEAETASEDDLVMRAKGERFSVLPTN